MDCDHLGFTPAYAGKIRKEWYESLILRVHPRIRGEDTRRPSAAVHSLGSPPHTRGRSAPAMYAAPQAGFTPAYAGKMPRDVVNPRLDKVHPRIRGEDFLEV